MLIGPPGSGRTELLQSLSALSDVHLVATLTEAALLSGTSAKDRAKGATGGLLPAIGSFGFIICKDFGSILSEHRDARAAVLAALREIYDGSWTRHLGIDGGRKLSWSGKVAVIAACTPILDSHHGVMSAMGERFVFYRLPPIADFDHAKRALAHSGKEAQMRDELTQAVAGLFASVDPSTVDCALTEADNERIIEMARLATRCRSAVERDNYTRQIVLIPEPEAPGRLALALRGLLVGMIILGIPWDKAWPLLLKVALDCMPPLRRAVFDLLESTGCAQQTSDVATKLGYPLATIRRTLEDLSAHGIVEVHAPHNADQWRLSDWARERLQQAQGLVPGMSGGP
jgi:hypothetical protein